MFCTKCGGSVADNAAFCPTCGAPVGAIGTAPQVPISTPAAPYAGSPAASAPYTAPPISYAPVSIAPYAGFWLRFVAALIDGLVIGIPVIAIIVAFAISMGIGAKLRNFNSDDPPAAMIGALIGFIALAIVVLVVGEWLYFSLMESSTWQGTLGKKAIGLFVTDLEGRRVTFGRASGRFAAGRLLGRVPGIGGLYFIVSCICAGFTERKQALHDMIAGTLVLRKN